MLGFSVGLRWCLMASTRNQNSQAPLLSITLDHRAGDTLRHVRILVSRQTEGLGPGNKCQRWHRIPSVSEWVETSIQLLALAAIAAGKGPAQKEGFLVLTGDGATTPLSAQAAEEPHPRLPKV